MAYVQKKKLTMWFFVSMALLVVIVYVAFITNLERNTKAIIILCLIALYVFIRRGYIYFYTGVNLMQTGNLDKAWKCFKKAIKANVGEEQQIMASSAFIQISNEPQYGVDVLEKIIGKSKNSQNVNSARVTVSMGYWRIGDTKKAIDELEDLKKTWCDNNLYVNLSTYYLETAELDKAKKILAQAKKENVDALGMVDNELWYCIETSMWQRAKKLADELVYEKCVKFSEAYVHAAQVYLHDGDTEKALDCLGWALGKKFSLVSTYTEQYIQTLINGISNPETSQDFIKNIDSNYVPVSCGKEFCGFECGKEYSGPVRPVKEPPKPGDVKIETTEDGLQNPEDPDDRIPNTDLTEED